VIDSEGLTVSDHVNAVCRSAYYHLRQLRVAVIARSLSDDPVPDAVSAGFHLVPPGLLQRTTVSVWHLWRSDSAPAVGAKRGSTADHWSSSVRLHHAATEIILLTTFSRRLMFYSNWYMYVVCPPL